MTGKRQRQRKRVLDPSVEAIVDSLTGPMRTALEGRQQYVIHDHPAIVADHIHGATIGALKRRGLIAFAQAGHLQLTALGKQVVERIGG